ncbi:uncharacterized protein LOC125378755 [Haliotis rufescens]|uniref:uncharacterized protein LOC125378755 n=1 Tax=Haliotis rufescens TaxID=6454 RepID=UPI00201F9C0F|nr:uncharacterized protein LOC125378755 [Haliotis rufescens]
MVKHTAALCKNFALAASAFGIILPFVMRSHGYDLLRPVTPPQNMTSYEIATVVALSLLKCSMACFRLTECRSFFYDVADGGCQLHRTVQVSSANNMKWTVFYVRVTPYWCPRDFILSQGMCLKYHTGAKTWLEANATCTLYPGYSRLVVMDTERKTNLVKATGIASNLVFTKGIWVGLSDHSSPRRELLWVDHQPFNAVIEYYDRVPDDENLCVRIVRALDWALVVSVCRRRVHYICEIVPSSENMALERLLQIL